MTDSMTRQKWLEGEDKPRKKAQPPMLRDGSIHQVVRRAVDAQETRVADAIGGRRTPASGSMPNRKGDGDTAVFKNECKLSVVKGSMKLKKEWFAKISREARLVEKKPMLAIELVDAEPGVAKDWVCVTLDDMEWLLRLAGLKKGA